MILCGHVPCLAPFVFVSIQTEVGTLNNHAYSSSKYIYIYIFSACMSNLTARRSLASWVVSSSFMFAAGMCGAASVSG